MKKITVYVKAFLSLILSIFRYPSIVFWCYLLIPVVSFTSGIQYYSIKNRTKIYQIPVFSLLISEEKSYKVVFWCRILTMVMYSQTQFFIIRYFIKSLRFSAPLAKIKIRNNIKVMAISSFIHFVSYVAATYINSQKSFKSHYISLIVSYLSEFLYLYSFNRMHMILEGELYPPGFYFDIIGFITLLISVPLLYTTINISNFSHKYMIGAASISITNSCILLKHVFISVIVLKNRFLKMPDLFLPIRK